MDIYQISVRTTVGAKQMKPVEAPSLKDAISIAKGEGFGFTDDAEVDTIEISKVDQHEEYGDQLGNDQLLEVKCGGLPVSDSLDRAAKQVSGVVA